MRGLFINSAHTQSLDAFVTALPSLIGTDVCERRQMAFPWYLAVVWHDRVQRFGLMYFSLIGAAITIAVGCGTSSLSPKPLFIEDQTFLEGFMIAVQRQGICLLLTGFVFGLTFWLVSERRRHSRSMEAS